MSRFKLLYFVIFIINLYKINAQISDKRLCADEKCEVPISLAKTLLRYSSPDSRILSFAPNVDITIYSKSAGSREDLWGGEIDGKRGYIPKHMVRETKVLQKPTFLVNTEFNNETEIKQVPSTIEPDKVQEPYEVIDGTTIYANPQEDISPSSTDSPIQSTALPASTEKITQNEQNLKEEKGQDSSQTDQSTQDINENVAENDKETADVTDDSEEEEDDEGEDDDAQIEDDDEEEEEDLEEQGQIVATESQKVQEQNQTEETVTEDSPADTRVQKEQTAEASAEDLNINTAVKTEPEALNTLLDDKPETESVNIPEPIENKIATDTIQSEVTSSSEENIKPNQDSSEENISPTEASPTKSEILTPPLEVTTISPEIEVPQPVDDIVDVTPNPVEKPPEESINVPTLPPFGLFKDPSSNSRENEEQVPIEDNFDMQLEEQKVAEDTSQEVEVKQEEQPTVAESKEGEVSEEDIRDVEQEEKIIVEETNNQEVSEDTSRGVEQEEQGNQEIPKDPSRSVEQEEQGNQEIPEDPSRSVEQEEQGNQEVSEDPSRSVEQEEQGPGLLDSILSMIGLGSEEKYDEKDVLTHDHMLKHVEDEVHFSTNKPEPYCDATSCESSETIIEKAGMDLFNFNPDIFLYLVTTAISVIIFLFGYIAFDKSKREGPLIAKINNLEKQLLIVVKENQILQEKLSTDSGYETNDRVPNEIVENLKQELLEMTNVKNALEEQIQSLEKELENSTEVGMELNKMLSEILSSENGSDVIKSNVEHLQRQLVEQQSTINSINETLAITNTENHELRLELELSNKKVFDLQTELDKLLLNILKLEEEKDTQQSSLENEITKYRQKYDEINSKLKSKDEEYFIEIKQLKNRLDQTERKLELKGKEHEVLTETLKQLKTVKNNDTSVLQNLLEVGGIKGELQLLKSENQKFSEKLQQEQEMKSAYEKRAQSAVEELQLMRDKYDEADKLRVETQTKLEVLSNYFKDREAQWQKEISKHEALWAEKEGEATSTTERIKFMQEQLQNYKTQTESLKQEIMSQEIELKSQISVLEKKVHENWVTARQAERKLEEAKQEAAQLRHRLTLRERAMQEDKTQHRLQSPIEQNGDMPVSPLESPASPPLLYGTRDHITKSPAIPGLPPFLPPPPGVPFMPPPIHGVPPFIPPPPNMFPGDHRPPPLGRMSSPPLNSRYSPSSRGYSPYDRNSSSPSDSEYGTSPPHRRAYSPFNNRDDRREYKRPPPGRANGRNLIKGGASSGSGNSNESLEKINRQQSKV